MTRRDGWTTPWPASGWWISGGADVDESPTEAALISGTTDFEVRKAVPRRFTDDDLQCIVIPVLALIAGKSVMLDAALATATARRLLASGQIELWSDASDAINGEYPAEIAERAGRFWDDVDAP